MSTQLQVRRGTTAQHNLFTGVQGEITVDVDKTTLVVHDGSTVGGFPLLRTSGDTMTGDLTVSDSNIIFDESDENASTINFTGPTANGAITYQHSATASDHSISITVGGTTDVIINNEFGDGQLLVGTNITDVTGTDGCKMHVGYDHVSKPVLTIEANNASYVGNVLRLITTDKAADTDWHFIHCTADTEGTPDVVFRVRGDGNVFSDGAYTGTGADYAEYFESVTGSEIEIGTTVVLDGEKIRPFTDRDDEDDIVGVVRPKVGGSSVIADSASEHWDKKYLKDAYGSYRVDNKGKKTINPNYTPRKAYVPRQYRKEWHVVGLVGKVAVTKGQKTNPQWKKMKDISDTVEQWLIK